MDSTDNRTVSASVLEPAAISRTVDAVLDMPVKPWMYQPGQSGNPSGRPKSKPVSDALRMLLEMPAEQLAEFKPTTGAQEIAWAQYLEATKGKVKTFAANFITDRVEGKVIDSDDRHGAVTFNVLISAPRPKQSLETDTDNGTD